MPSKYQNIFIQNSLLCCAILVSGCAFNDESKQVNIDPEPEGIVDIYIADELSPFQTHKRVNDYTSRLAYDLAKNLYSKKLDTPVAVASFVNFDTNANNTSRFGNLISESMLGQLQVQNITVVDIHLLDKIEINKQGDIILNRSTSEYFIANEVKYVLTGTIIKDLKGVTINARISELDSQRVMTSATTLIPYYVADLYD